MTATAEKYNVVSIHNAANKDHPNTTRLSLFEFLMRSPVHIEKRQGAKTLPCLTPHTSNLKYIIAQNSVFSAAAAADRPWRDAC